MNAKAHKAELVCGVPGKPGSASVWKRELMLCLHSQGPDSGLDSGMGEHIIFWGEAGLQGSENSYHESWYQPAQVSVVCWLSWNWGAAEQVAEFTFFLEPGGLCGGMYVSGVCLHIGQEIKWDKKKNNFCCHLHVVELITRVMYCFCYLENIKLTN